MWLSVFGRVIGIHGSIGRAGCVESNGNAFSAAAVHAAGAGILSCSTEPRCSRVAHRCWPARLVCMSAQRLGAAPAGRVALATNEYLSSRRTARVTARKSHGPGVATPDACREAFPPLKQLVLCANPRTPRPRTDIQFCTAVCLALKALVLLPLPGFLHGCRRRIQETWFTNSATVFPLVRPVHKSDIFRRKESTWIWTW